MGAVLRAIAERVELRPARSRPDPVVLRGITLAPARGVEVIVEAVRTAAERPEPAAAVVAASYVSRGAALTGP